MREALNWKKTLPWAFVLALALFLRLALLGALPLDDREAALALRAWEMAQGERLLLPAELTYLFPSAALFWLQAAGNWAARLWPALAGVGLVLAPWVLRHELGERFAFWLAFGLALDPFLVAASRRADGAMLAAAALVWALVALRRGRLFGGGFALMLALMSGPAIWFLVTGGLLTLSLLTLFAYNQVQMTWDMIRWLWPAGGKRMRSLWLGAAAALLLAACLHPPALTAWLNALPRWLAGWNSPQVAHPGLFFLAGGIFYGFLPLGLAILARLDAWRRGHQDFFAAALGVWGAATALVVLLYPAHQPIDWLWAMLPLWWLGAAFLARSEPFLLNVTPAATAAAAISLAVLAFLWMQLQAVLLRFGPYPQAVTLWGWTFTMSERSLQWVVWVVGWLIWLVALSLVASFGGQRETWRGFWQALGIFAFVITLSFAWGATGARVPDGFELWQAEGKTVGAPVLRATLETMIARNGGEPDELPIVLVGIDSPALRWTLRGYAVSVAPGPEIGDSPAFVISMETENFPALQAYRGSPFAWRRQPAWHLGPDSAAWGRWIFLRQAPAIEERVVLWARADLFPDGNLLP